MKHICTTKLLEMKKKNVFACNSLKPDSWNNYQKSKYFENSMLFNI